MTERAREIKRPVRHGTNSVFRTSVGSGGLRRSLLAACLFVSFIQSLFFAYALVPEVDDALHMFLGRSALSGEISLFQDEMTGHRVPLSHYFIGLSQILWPGSVVAARLFSAGLGTLSVLLLFFLATRLGGELCGTLTTLFAVTHGVIIGYFVYASYHSLVSFLLLAGFYVLLCTSLRYKRVVAMSLFSLIFFTRSLMIPVIPLAFLYLIWEAKRWGERLAIVAVTVVPPVAFFLYDVNHLKLLAHVPVLNRVVLPLGFQSLTILTPAFPHEADLGASVMNALTVLVRWYKVWIVAALVLVAWAVLRVVRGLRVGGVASNRGVNMITVVALYLALSQVLIFFRHSFSMAVGYFPSFAILATIWLGFGFSVLIESVGSVWRRRAVLVALAGLFLVAPALSRSPTLPLAVAYDYPPTLALYSLGEALGRVIPKGSRVFHIGATQALYMAGLKPYLRQVYDVWTLAPTAEEWVRKKSGLWGGPEIRAWLTTDAEYAVIVPTVLDFYRASADAPLRASLDLIESLLAEHFTRVAVLDQYPGLVFHVYKRTSRV